MKALCFALFACAFNLLIGYGGLLSFGHAMFFGWASYVAAHLAKVGTVSLPYWAGEWHWLAIPLPAQSPELAIFGGTLVAGILGVIVGSVAIRRQGIYFAMITLALAQMMYFFALQAKFTGGEDGIQGVPRGKLFGFIDLADTMTMYVVVGGVFLAAFLLIYRIVHSPFGEVLKAIRENEPRAISLGYKTERYKLVAFVLSATFAGLAGATKALVFQLASLTDVHWHDVRRGRADDARRRPRHHLRPGGGRADHRRHADLFRELRRMGAGHPGRDLRRLRAGVPPRRRRRARRAAPHQAVKGPVARMSEEPVARIERSEIRERLFDMRRRSNPDFAALNPGYRLQMETK